MSDDIRTLPQNDHMWGMLECWSDQKPWQINGCTCKMDKEEWKDVLTATFRKEQIRMSPLLDGSGVVMLGSKTRKMLKREMSEFIEWLYAIGSEQEPPIRYPAREYA